MKKRDRNTSPIGDVMGDLLKIYRLEDKFSEIDVVEAWKEIMGSAIASKTRKILVRKKVLIIYVDSGVLKEEFSMAKARIVTLINEHLGKEVISDVQVY
jgi:predicted nucleic acid-binding Zn ribbon protein|tara:strand:- start:2 stop:298 length:297 start_codon:yes stop_codon:yes gene_type:complete